MLSKLLKRWRRQDTPGWEHSDPAVRINAARELAASQPPSAQSTLTALAQTDADLHVRRAAIAGLTDRGVLQSLADDSDLNTAVLERLAVLVGDAAQTDAPSSLDSDLALAALRQNIATEQHQALAQRALAELPPEHLLAAATDSARPEWRMLAAERITDASVLTDLERRSRTKDKAVNRLARDRLESARQFIARTVAATEECADLAERAVRLTSAPLEPLYGAKLAHLQERYEAATAQCKSIDADALELQNNDWRSPATLAQAGRALRHAQERLQEANAAALRAAELDSAIADQDAQSSAPQSDTDTDASVDVTSDDGAVPSAPAEPAPAHDLGPLLAQLRSSAVTHADSAGPAWDELAARIDSELAAADPDSSEHQNTRQLRRAIEAVQRLHAQAAPKPAEADDAEATAAPTSPAGTEIGTVETGDGTPEPSDADQAPAGDASATVIEDASAASLTTPHQTDASAVDVAPTAASTAPTPLTVDGVEDSTLQPDADSSTSPQAQDESGSEQNAANDGAEPAGAEAQGMRHPKKRTKAKSATPKPPLLWQRHRTELETAKATRQQLSAVAWPDELPAPDIVTELRATQERMRATIDATEAEIDTGLKRLQEISTALESAMQTGALKATGSLLAQGRQLQRQLPTRIARTAVAEFTARADQVTEMRDWQAFATTPKREALCEEIADLAASDMPAEPRAQRIKALRAQWNELGVPGSARDRALGAQFNKSADRAFEPCRVYFQEQAAIRAQNLAGRSQVCEELSQYLAATPWDQPTKVDWKAAQQILRTARSEFIGFHPVDRSKARRVERQFDELAETLHGNIGAEMQRNIGAREQLIESARSLAANDQLEVADRADAAKALQRQWRDVGLVPRKDDQRLWQEFRSACDLVFAAREAAQSQLQEETAATLARADTLQSELSALVAAQTDGGTQVAPEATSGDEPARTIAVVTAELEALVLPTKARAAADAQITEVGRVLTARRQQQRRAQDAAKLEQLLQLHDQLTGAEAAGEYPDTLINDAIDAGVQQRLPEEVQTGSANTADGSYNRDDLTILAEVMTERASPSHLGARRMELKVAQLSAGLGGDSEQPQTMLALVREWVNAGPGDSAQTAELGPRLRACFTEEATGS